MPLAAGQHVWCLAIKRVTALLMCQVVVHAPFTQSNFGTRLSRRTQSFERWLLFVSSDADVDRVLRDAPEWEAKTRFEDFLLCPDSASDESPELSLLRLRTRMIETYSPFRVVGPVFTLKTARPSGEL